MYVPKNILVNLFLNESMLPTIVSSPGSWFHNLTPFMLGILSSLKGSSGLFYYKPTQTHRSCEQCHMVISLFKKLN